MNAETREWLDYAAQDDQSARLLLQSHLYNPCLYHIQQSIEKCLKAVIIEHELAFQRTHSIQALVNILMQADIAVDIDADDIDLIDSIYMPARYPLGSALPQFEPDQAICQRCLQIAEHIRNWVTDFLADSVSEPEEEQPVPRENPEFPNEE